MAQEERNIIREKIQSLSTLSEKITVLVAIQTYSDGGSSKRGHDGLGVGMLLPLHHINEYRHSN